MKPFQNKLDAASIKEEVNPYDFYLRELNLHRFGNKSGRWAVAGLCPFHDDGRQGSFKVNLDTGAFKCWSCGAAGGDVIAFVQKRDGIEFIQALRKLSEDWRVG